MTIANDMDAGPAPATPVAYPDGITVEHDSFKTIQKVHAVAIAVLPLAGTVAALWIAAVHGVSWLDLGLAFVMYVVTIFGISVGYHRLFSHRAFKAAKSVRVALAIAGSMAAQGSVVYWVSNHRRHHQFTDRLGDIHSPYVDDDDRRLGFWEGFWHSHMGWTFDHKMTNAVKFAKDLYRDPAVARANRLYYLWVVLGLAVPAAIGGLVTMSLWGAFTAFLWGGLVRMFLSYHTVNGIDSVTHLFGSQPFKSEDHSRNNRLWAILTLGEGWHNNHHAFPSSAVFGLEWYQIDPGTWLLRGLEKLGLVWDIQRPTETMIAAKKA